MSDFAERDDGRALTPGEPGQLVGVQGWLLCLCLMLTVVGPLSSAWLAGHEYERFSRYFADSPGVHAAILLSLALRACSVAYGIHAGIQLWSIRPHAVTTAKRALLFALAVGVVAAFIAKALAPVTSGDERLLHQVELHMIPGLVFFTLCFGYLNRSARVAATYRAVTG